MSEQRLIHTFGEEPQTFAFCLVNDGWTSSLMPKEITGPGELYNFSYLNGSNSVFIKNVRYFLEWREKMR